MKECLVIVDTSDKVAGMIMVDQNKNAIFYERHEEFNLTDYRVVSGRSVSYVKEIRNSVSPYVSNPRILMLTIFQAFTKKQWNFHELRFVEPYCISGREIYIQI